MKLPATTVFDEMAAVVHAGGRRTQVRVSPGVEVQVEVEVEVYIFSQPYFDFPASSQGDIDTAHIDGIDIAQI